MKKRIIPDDAIRVMNRNEIKNLSEKEIASLTLEQCNLLSFEQLDWLDDHQLKYFTSVQKKNQAINIITKSIDEIQKINLNALSDIELKSMRINQIKALTYNQIVNILPYIHYQNKISTGTIGNFRPKQYNFFTLRQIKWMTMYQAANIPKNYLSIDQMRVLPPMCFDFPRDTFAHFIHRDDVPHFDCKKMTPEIFKYISKYTLRLFTEKQINDIPNIFFSNAETITKLKLLSKKQLSSIDVNKYRF